MEPEAFELWSVKRLQAYIKEKGGNPQSCIEKVDLVAVARGMSDQPGGTPYGPPGGPGAYPGSAPGGSYPPAGVSAYPDDSSRGPYPGASGGGGNYPSGVGTGGGAYPGAPGSGGASNSPYPDLDGPPGGGGGLYGNTGGPPAYPGPERGPSYGGPAPGSYGGPPSGNYGGPPAGGSYPGAGGGPPSGGNYPPPGGNYPSGGPPYPPGMPAPQYNQGPSPYPSYQPPPVNHPPPGPNYIPPGPPPPQPAGGGYNSPPPGPGQNNMHMQHGPTPYANGVPSAPQQQGSGMTSEGGRKKALICGCNYKGSSAALGGCINDAQCMRYLLISKFGFRSEDITMLTDDQSQPAGWPTKQNMIANMQRLVGDARPGDSLIFHYSGHGSQTQDWQGEEEDGYNETLCPCDFRQAGMIVDNELNRLLVNPLPSGVRLHAIIDACHSGSMLDLECRAEFKRGFANWQNEYRRRPKVYKGTRGGEAIQFGAARDSQTAADTAKLSGSVSTGAATFSFIQAVERAGTRISYGQLLQEMNATLAGMAPKPAGGGGGGSFGMGGLLGSLLDAGGGGGGGGYKGQTPVLSSNMPFDLSRPIHI